VRADGAEGVDVLALQSRTDHRACAVAPTFSLAFDLLAYRAAQFF
jgi:hypothetical protein